VTVADVQVMTLDEAGKVVEKGEGIRKKGDWWEYAPTTEGKVVVEVRDRAGNVVKEKISE
jgi:hypothetical protein